MLIAIITLVLHCSFEIDFGDFESFGARLGSGFKRKLWQQFFLVSVEILSFK
jgi:hypothetical protein